MTASAGAGFVILGGLFAVAALLLLFAPMAEQVAAQPRGTRARSVLLAFGLFALLLSLFVPYLGAVTGIAAILGALSMHDKG